MDADNRTFDEAQQLTAMSFRRFLDTTDKLTMLKLTMPEREELSREIAKVVPAGNVPSLVAAGLASLPDRAVPVNETRRHLSQLLQGMQTFLDQAAFRAFFEGPARLLSAYQMMLRLTGKDLEQSFPEGTWQFYVEFGLREDTSRHVYETLGFQKAGLDLSPADQLASWIAASFWLLKNYEKLLDIEWSERAYLRQLETTPTEHRILDAWLRIRPYGLIDHEEAGDFLAFRQQEFQKFAQEQLNKLHPNQRRQIERGWNDQKAIAKRTEQLAAYQRQLSILATLTPGEHSDMRLPIQLSDLRIAVISSGRYYLIDGNLTLPQLRGICASILRYKADFPPAALDKALVTARRHDQIGLRRILPVETQAELQQLRTAPIVINWDVAKSDQPLDDIRGGRRGIGDHAFTIFRAANSTVFDMSHIFFDGPWGMATSEIITQQATYLARQISQQADPSITLPTANNFASGITSLALQIPPQVAARARRVQILSDVSAESATLRLNLIQTVRRSLDMRNAELKLTVNDLLILYRSIFGPTYQPSAQIVSKLTELGSSGEADKQQVVQFVHTALEAAKQPNPALLIPVDATKLDPRNRIYPLTFRNPFPDIMQKHQRALQAMKALDFAEAQNKAPRGHEVDEARAARKDYLMLINIFGKVMEKYKEISLKGESLSTTTIKLLAGLPAPIKKLLASYPDHFDMLNDTIKGQEVFSNVGKVSASSSLRRFNTAKDDNDKKTLAWGIMTDSEEIVHFSLRDFRPHVQALVECRQEALAQAITQDYLDAFVSGLEIYLNDILQIVRARRKLR